jgi:hypothetical protein
MGSCSAPFPLISADRTLLMHIRPVVLQFFRVLGVSQDEHTLDKLNCAKRQLSLPAEFGGHTVSSLEPDAELARNASFTATLANLITDYESESLGPMYCLIRQELLNVATSTLPRAVLLRRSYDTISTMGGFSESDLVVLSNTLTLSRPFRVCWARCRVGGISGEQCGGARYPILTCLQLPTPDALTRSGDSGATFNGAFRAFFVPEPILTSWRFADLPNRTI